MVNLEKSINALLAERAQLLNQLDAVDDALAALRGTVVPAAPPADVARAVSADPEVTRVAPKRVLSEEHKRKLAEGRQGTLHTKAVAKGMAREPLEGLSALTAPLSAAPRLVKRSAARERGVDPQADAGIDRRDEVTP